MAQTTLSPTLIQSIGSFTQIVVGVAVGASTTNVTTVITVPQFLKIKAVIVSGATSTTAVYCDTITNTTLPPTFTATHASGDRFAYIAYGDAKI